MRTAIVSGAIVALCAIILISGSGDDTGPNAFIIIGVSQGAVYGLVSLGLVLVYKGSRVFNFAQGEFGSIAAFIVYVLIEQVRSMEIPYGVAALIAVIGVVIIGLIMERVIVRPLLNAPRVTLLVATIAFALFAIGTQLLLFLPEPKSLAPIISKIPGGGNVELFNFIVEPQRLLVLAILVVVAGVLGYFFSRTDLGLAVLATSQDAFATRVVGIGVERMSRFIWGTAAFLGAVAGILYVPLSGALTPGVMTSGVLIPSFTGAVIGGMTSLPGAFVGGVIVGIVQALSNWGSGHYYLGERLWQDIVPGGPDVLLMLVLLLVLLIRPQGLLGSEA
ncbi:MAG TPA: branched-chain amino acid ABC transporter permease [Actinomycetota bacterium]|nr:branched-chain amino acid ABC transporter permease [Actinomycetota bacterium]